MWETMSPINSLLSRRGLLTGGLALGLAACERRAATSEAAPPAARTTPPAAAEPVPVPTGEQAIVTVLGDSITAGLGLPSAQALPIQLEAALTRAGLNTRVRAAGVSGDTTAGGLARVDFSVQDDTEVAVVALGGNDLLQGVDPARVRANLDAIITRLKARGITVVLAGMRGPPQFGTYTAAFDRVFPELASKHGVLLYPFLLEGVALVERYNQADGIHPNAEGARLIAEGLAPVVAAAIRNHAAAAA
jgi:acyl-CoA thioesterase-1